MRIDQTEYSEIQSPKSLILFNEAEFIGEALLSYLNSMQLFEQVFLARSWEVLQKRLLQTYKPIVMLTEEIPNWSFQKFILKIRDWNASSRIIIFAQHHLEISHDSFQVAQPKGIINQNDPLEEIIHGIRKVIEGQTYCSTSIENRADQSTQKSSTQKRRKGLTRRQQEVLCKLAEGHSVKEIAEMMQLSPKSIDSHKYRIMKKLKLNDRVRLARFAIREGMIEP